MGNAPSARSAPASLGGWASVVLVGTRSILPASNSEKPFGCQRAERGAPKHREQQSHDEGEHGTDSMLHEENVAADAAEQGCTRGAEAQRLRACTKLSPRLR